MKFKVSDIIKADGSFKDIKTELKNIDIQSKEIEIIDGGFFKGIIKNIKGSLSLRGSLCLSYKTNCYRCLKKTERSLKIVIDELFSIVKDKDEIYYHITDNYIDIDKALTDNIILNLPMKDYCREDCKGLCSKCGAIVNETVCECGNEEYINPQFEILNKYKDT
ncbi:MAG: DUF177 domain-containing protein [Clostridiales bacterium]